MSSDSRTVYRVQSVPKGLAYRRLMNALRPAAATIGFIVQRGLQLSPRAQTVLETLEPARISVEEVTAWPGSELEWGSEFRYLHALTDEVFEAVVAATDSLYDWVNPDLPEDLHLLRLDGTTILGTTAQERHAWLELSEDELHDLEASLEPIGIRLEPPDA